MKTKKLMYYIMISLLSFTYSCDKKEESTVEINQFTDSRDGEKYKTIKIDNQVWMAENLNYETTSGSWIYDNNSSNAEIYGRLYNWETACEACPSGWHLPSDAEWTELENYLIDNGYNYDGSTTGNKIGKALAASSGWSSSSGTGNIGNDQQNNNSTGFTALPGGYYHWEGYFGFGSGFAYFWSSTSYTGTQAWSRWLGYPFDELIRNNFDKRCGQSVRCLKN